MAPWRARGVWIVLRGVKGSPSPKGEGWGEGKETNAPRSTNVFALARG
jgi:hypothetical protein